MKFVTVTSFATRHWDQYAKRCVESYRNFWKDVPLLIYKDEDLDFRSEWLREFKIRNRDRKFASYRFDAIRFAHKVAAIDLAFKDARVHHDADCLIWMDADCFTHDVVNEPWLYSLIKEQDFGYLMRQQKYPECGFMMFRLGSPEVQSMIWDLVQLYATDRLFGLKEWHDSYAIEHCRVGTPGLKCRSLSGWAEKTGHPLINGPLGAKLDHLKGTRKLNGKSRVTDLKTARPEAYWS